MPASLTRNLVTGGAGFLDSHLWDRLMEAGEEVIFSWMHGCCTAVKR